MSVVNNNNNNNNNYYYYYAKNYINALASRFLRIVPNGINIYVNRSKYYYVNEEKDKNWTNIMEDATTHIFFHEIIRGLGIILSQVFREPATINYPFEKGPLSPRFRGEHALRRYVHKPDILQIFLYILCIYCVYFDINNFYYIYFYDNKM